MILGLDDFPRIPITYFESTYLIVYPFYTFHYTFTFYSFAALLILLTVRIGFRNYHIWIWETCVMKSYTSYFVYSVVIIFRLDITFPCISPLARYSTFREVWWPPSRGHPSRGRSVNCCTIAQTFQSQQQSPRRIAAHLPRAKNGFPHHISLSLVLADRAVWQTRRIKLFTRRLEILSVLISGSPRRIIFLTMFSTWLIAWIYVDLMIERSSFSSHVKLLNKLKLYIQLTRISIF